MPDNHTYNAPHGPTAGSSHCSPVASTRPTTTSTPNRVDDNQNIRMPSVGHQRRASAGFCHGANSRLAQPTLSTLETRSTKPEQALLPNAQGLRQLIQACSKRSAPRRARSNTASMTAEKNFPPYSCRRVIGISGTGGKAQRAQRHAGGEHVSPPSRRHPRTARRLPVDLPGGQLRASTKRSHGNAAAAMF